MRTGLGPPGTVEHGAADGPLEGGDLLADGGLGVAEALRRPSERAFHGDRVERQQVAQFEAGEGALQTGGWFGGHRGQATGSSASVIDSITNNRFS